MQTVADAEAGWREYKKFLIIIIIGAVAPLAVYEMCWGTWGGGERVCVALQSDAETKWWHNVFSLHELCGHLGGMEATGAKGVRSEIHPEMSPVVLLNAPLAFVDDAVGHQGRWETEWLSLSAGCLYHCVDTDWCTTLNAEVEGLLLWQLEEINTTEKCVQKLKSCWIIYNSLCHCGDTPREEISPAKDFCRCLNSLTSALCCLWMQQ